MKKIIPVHCPDHPGCRLLHTGRNSHTLIILISETGGESFFTMDMPDYKVQPRDILYVSAKAQTPEGMLEEMLQRQERGHQAAICRVKHHSIYMGYSIDPEGM